MLEFIVAHQALIGFIAFSVLSEAVAIIQVLKYPTNQGVGGVMAYLVKLLQSLGFDKSPSA